MCKVMVATPRARLFQLSSRVEVNELQEGCCDLFDRVNIYVYSCVNVLVWCYEMDICCVVG